MQYSKDEACIYVKELGQITYYILFACHRVAFRNQKSVQKLCPNSMLPSSWEIFLTIVVFLQKDKRYDMKIEPI